MCIYRGKLLFVFLVKWSTLNKLKSHIGWDGS